MSDGILCLACGEPIPKATNRRTISHRSSRHVTASWKTCFKQALKNNKQFNVLETAFPESGEIVTANLGNQKHVCKRCFYLFEKFIEIEQV